MLTLSLSIYCRQCCQLVALCTCRVEVLGIFTVVTMWAVVVTEGCRKIKLQYYGFKLASAAR